MRRHCGTQARETRQKLPDWVAKIPIHSDLTPQTTSLAFCSQLTWVFNSHGPPLMPLSNWSTQGNLVTVWLQIPSPLGSSSSESGDTPYYFSPPQWHSYCHCTALYKWSVLSGPGVRIHLLHIEPESLHWSPLQCEWSSSLHVWHGIRRHQWSEYPWW